MATADDKENLLFYWWNDSVLCVVMVDRGSSMWECRCVCVYVFLCEGREQFSVSRESTE